MQIWLKKTNKAGEARQPLYITPHLHLKHWGLKMGRNVNYMKKKKVWIVSVNQFILTERKEQLLSSWLIQGREEKSTDSGSVSFQAKS